MKLNKRNQYLNISSEGSPPRKRYMRLKISKFIYFGVLFSILSWLGYSVFSVVYFISGTGVVCDPSITVASLNDLIIDDIPVHEGDTLFPESRLFSVRYSDDTFTSLVTRRPSKSTAPLSQLNKTDRDIALKKVDLIHLQKEIETTADEIGKLKRMQSLEMITRDKIRKQEEYLETLKRKESELKEEIDVLGFYRNRISTDTARAATAGLLSFGDGSTADSLVMYTSDTVIVERIMIKKNDVVFRGDPVMILTPLLRKQDIVAYFKQKEYPHIQVGRRVTIRLPGGGSVEGEITRVYTELQTLPAELQQKHEPTERAVAARIRPIPAGNEPWINRSYLEVEILMKRFNYE